MRPSSFRDADAAPFPGSAEVQAPCRRAHGIVAGLPAGRRLMRLKMRRRCPIVGLARATASAGARLPFRGACRAPCAEAAGDLRVAAAGLVDRAHLSAARGHRRSAIATSIGKANMRAPSAPVLGRSPPPGPLSPAEGAGSGSIGGGAPPYVTQNRHTLACSVARAPSARRSRSSPSARRSRRAGHSGRKTPPGRRALPRLPAGRSRRR